MQNPKFGLMANYHIPRVCDFNFMLITNLRIYKGFDRENRSGCKFTPSVNKGRFCNTIASVALVHTSIQNDKRMQTKEILSSRN